MATIADDAPPSFQSQVRSLQPGESVAQVKRLWLGQPAAEAIDKMRQTIDPFVSRCRNGRGAHKKEYTVEQGTFLTTDHTAVLAFVVVTRLA